MKTTLVTPAELAAAPQWRVFDCRHELSDPRAGATQYAAGHIPGALHAHLDDVLSSKPTGSNGRHPLPDRAALADWLGRQGVGPDDQVVVYDAAGGAMAARLWWLLRWMGHEAVAVLDGGLQAWEAAGLPITQDVPTFAATVFPLRPTLAETLPVIALLDNLGTRTRLVVDARGAGRYAGEGETIDPRAGHIPGAVNRPFTDNLDADGRFKAPETLRAEWQAVIGTTPVERVIAQCGSGVTACHNLLALEIAGLSGAKLYPGSWSEWCSNPARPIATGPNP